MQVLAVAVSALDCEIIIYLHDSLLEIYTNMCSYCFFSSTYTALYRVYNTRSRTISDLEKLVAQLRNELNPVKAERERLREDQYMIDSIHKSEIEVFQAKTTELINMVDKATAKANEFHEMYVQASKLYESMKEQYEQDIQVAGNNYKQVQADLTAIINELQAKCHEQEQANMALKKENLVLKYGKDAVEDVDN